MKKVLLLSVALYILAILAPPVMTVWDDEDYRYTTWSNIQVGKSSTWNSKSGILKFWDLYGTRNNVPTADPAVYYLFIWKGAISVNTTFPNKGGD